MSGKKRLFKKKIYNVISKKKRKKNSCYKNSLFPGLKIDMIKRADKYLTFFIYNKILQ